MIGIVGMQHGAVTDRQAQILVPATAAIVAKGDAIDLAAVVAADPVGNAEIVALAGDDHIVIAVIAHPAGLPGQPGGNRTGNGQRVALAFLAAKAAAHPPHFDPDGVHRQPQRLGNLVLHLGRVLGRGMDHHVAIVLRQGQRHLPLQIEMLLSADLDPALDHHWRCSNRGLRVALAPQLRPALKPRTGGQRVVNRQDRLFLGIGNPPQPCGLARRQMAGGHHQKHRLTDVMHQAPRQQRLIPGMGGRQVDVMRQVGVGQHPHHAGGRAHRRKVHRGNGAACDGGQAERQVQCVGRGGNIVDIAGLAGDMQRRAVMGQGGADAHGCTARMSVIWPCLSCHSRASMACAAASR